MGAITLPDAWMVSRTGGRITEVIDSVIQSLLDEGKLGEAFGTWSWKYRERSPQQSRMYK